MRLTSRWTRRCSNAYNSGNNAELMTLWLIMLGVWVVVIPAVVLAVAGLLPWWMERRPRPALATVHHLRRPEDVPARRRAAG